MTIPSFKIFLLINLNNCSQRCYQCYLLLQDDEAGVIPRAAFHIFEELNKLSRAETMVKVSFIELYNEEIRDLLSEDEGTLK